MRFPDGDVDTTWLSWKWDFRGYDDETSTSFENGFPSRGAPNRHESPGFVIIGTAADSVDEATARIHWTDPIWDELFEYSLLVKSLARQLFLPSPFQALPESARASIADIPNRRSLLGRRARAETARLMLVSSCAIAVRIWRVSWQARPTDRSPASNLMVGWRCGRGRHFAIEFSRGKARASSIRFHRRSCVALTVATL